MKQQIGLASVFVLSSALGGCVLEGSVRSGAVYQGSYATTTTTTGGAVVAADYGYVQTQAPGTVYYAGGNYNGTYYRPGYYVQSAPFVTIQQTPPQYGQPGVITTTTVGGGVVQPAAVQPGYVQGGYVQGGYVQGGVVQPAVVQPRTVVTTTTVGGGVVQPAYVQPGVVQPAVVQPAVVQPAVVQPAVVQPAVVRPAVVQPAVVQPAVVQPAGSIGVSGSINIQAGGRIGVPVQN